MLKNNRSLVNETHGEVVKCEKGETGGQNGEFGKRNRLTQDRVEQEVDEETQEEPDVRSHVFATVSVLRSTRVHVALRVS